MYPTLAERTAQDEFCS